MERGQPLRLFLEFLFRRRRQVAERREQ